MDRTSEKGRFLKVKQYLTNITDRVFGIFAILLNNKFVFEQGE